MKIYLARHGQSQWQVQPSDDWDSSLTAVGHEQAKRLARWLARRHPILTPATRVELVTLYSSPLKRARETAAYAASALDLPVVMLPGLREAEFHLSDHLPRTATPLQKPVVVAASDSYAAFELQAEATLRDLVVNADGGSVLAISHGGLIKTMLRLALGAEASSFRLYNTGLILLEWHSGRWHLVHLNLWDHLPTQLRTF